MQRRIEKLMLVWHHDTQKLLHQKYAPAGGISRKNVMDIKQHPIDQGEHSKEGANPSFCSVL